MAKIPITRPWLGEEEAEAARQAILSGWVAQGPRVAEFERQFAARVGAAEGIAVSSCTTGLHLALLASGVRPGDEVVVPSLSFIATANVVVHAGAVPVFADVTDDSQNVSEGSIAAALSERTRAVIVAHQVGEPADLDAIGALCRERGVALIEDAACAIGSQYRGTPIGGGGNTAVFSFHPRKILTTGEGGMITCSDPAVASRLRRLRNHAMSRSAADRASGGNAAVCYDEVGFNYRMTDIQAAVGLVQLGKLDAILTRRREQAARYIALIGDARLSVRLPPAPDFGASNFQSFTIRLEMLRFQTDRVRDDVVVRLQAAGIGAIAGIVPAHRERAYSARVHAPLPHTDQWASSAVMLPLFHALTEQDQGTVVRALGDAIEAVRAQSLSRA
jgi:dTDP-4-amino-4,6-dideoxygalactose transaminase